jgi:zinc protease
VVHALAPVALAAQARVTVPYTIDTLANGLTLIVHEDHSVPIVSTNVWYRVGSGDEQPGRTGFAHLFEHLMFMGSEHAPYPAFDRMLEAVGANNNGSTWYDRTNYFEEGPSNSLALMLWLEADRMGWFLPTMDSAKLDLQRDVVKNERRQSYENQPYGLADETILRMVYPAGHPLQLANDRLDGRPLRGDAGGHPHVLPEVLRPQQRRHRHRGRRQDPGRSRAGAPLFADIPRGPAIVRPSVAPFRLSADTVAVLEDRVQLPRVYYTWHTTRAYTPDDNALRLLAYILAGAKNSRLTKPLVYDLQLATEVEADQSGFRLDDAFGITATARPGHALPELQAVVDREVALLVSEGPTARELEQAKNSTEAAFLARLEQVSQKADMLNQYAYLTGDPGYFAKELAGLRAVTRDDVQRVARTYLGVPKVLLSVVALGKPELAARAAEATP